VPKKAQPATERMTAAELGELAARARYIGSSDHKDIPDAFADALTRIYATDPNYGTALKRLMKSNNLYQYD
jgi:flagellum-specific peptidoglycan hydrolase FlgJ